MPYTMTRKRFPDAYPIYHIFTHPEPIEHQKIITKFLAKVIISLENKNLKFRPMK